LKKMADSIRTCPACGARTPLAYCTIDGSPTVVAALVAHNLAEYRKDHVVGDRYRIIEPLGKGKATVVFDTEHVGTGQRVAVKLLSADPTNDDGMVAIQRFFREARVSASLDHPNTVRVFDVGQDRAGALFLAMDRLTGETLAQILQRKLIADETLAQAEAITVGVAVLDALSAAHERGLVHRDLKPSNVMLSIDRRGQEVVKVLDFGVARTMNSALTRLGELPGAPRYMSPEQCAGRRVDGRSDLYSLACLLYCCVASRPPFEGREPLQIMALHLDAAPPDPRTLTSARLSDRFVSVLMTALAKEPDARYRTADEMKAALEHLRVQPTRSPSHRHMGSGSSDPTVQSKVLARMAEQANDPARAYEYARAAMKLDPKNLAARKIARGTLARLRSASGSMPAVPPPLPGDQSRDG